jgi:hydrogenase maturation factor
MKPLELGKVSRKFLREVVMKNTGAKSPASVVGPSLGFDNAIISLGGRRIMVITSDPLSIIPSLGMKESAWLTVHELASDLTTSAVRPQFAVLTFNLPPAQKMDDFALYFRELSKEFKRLGVSIVGGHTGKYPGCDFTIVGGGVLMGFAEEGRYLTPAMVQGRDRVLITKGAAIETTAVLARAFPARVREKLGESMQRKAAGYLFHCSTVKDALSAASVGIKEEGVSSMHDATEGGVLGGLYELAAASGKRIQVDPLKVFVSEESRKICTLFKLDPLTTLSEGTLILTCSRNNTERVQRRLLREGVESYMVGEVAVGGPAGLWLTGREGRPTRYLPPNYDHYWDAYSRAVTRGWS